MDDLGGGRSERGGGERAMRREGERKEKEMINRVEDTEIAREC